MTMQIQHSKAGAVTVVSLTGRLTLGDAVNDLLETCKNLVVQGEKSLLVNLQGLSYMDSAGLGALVKCFNLAKAQSAKLKLLQVPASIRELMRITNLLTYFEVHDDENTALASFV